jgi:glycosyltransferase involved in cell wall biosynthesis
MVRDRVINSYRSATRLADVALIAKPGGRHTGVGRYVHMLEDHLSRSDVDAERVGPSLPPFGSLVHSIGARAGVDVRTFLTNYPVWAKYPKARVYHYTSQNLASLMYLRPPDGPAVVTVHDIIPYMLRNDDRLSTYQGRADRYFDSIAMKGLRTADYLVADSVFTRRCLIDHLGINPNRISVVYLGIDHTRFRKVSIDRDLMVRCRLRADRRYLIYVGSEDPRKNLKTLLIALAKVRDNHQDVELIKVGRAHFESERSALTDLATNLGIRPAIHFLDDVPEDDLPLLYNLATICVMPSFYEGFGFPVLEAMACETPVVCSNAASLPELVGDAAILFEPGLDSERRLTNSIVRVLNSEELQRRLRIEGSRQSSTFTWDRTAKQMRDIYYQFGLGGYESEIETGKSFDGDGHPSRFQVS